MTTLCITGSPQSTLESTLRQLSPAGVAPAQPTLRDTRFDFSIWHQRTLAAMDKAESAQPSRLWEQLAADLFLANMESPLWGWAEADTVRLLDFWAGFEPGIQFLLLCQTPQQAIERLLGQAGTEIDIAATLRDWQMRHQAMLRFHLRNPRRSLLLWAHEAEQAPVQLVECLNRQWDLALSAALPAADAQRPADPLATHLARQITNDYPELASLCGELNASVTRLLPDSATPAHEATFDPADLVGAYHRLLERQAEAEQQAAQRALQTAAQTDDTRQRLETAETRLKEAQEEGELLLLQLHQVQEELESVFLKQRDSEQRATTLAAERDQLAKGKADLQSRITTLEKESTAQARLASQAQSSLDTSKKEIDQLKQKLQQTQGTLDKTAQQQRESEKLAANLQSRITTLEKDSAAQARLASQAQAGLDAGKKEIDQLKQTLQQAQGALDKATQQQRESEQRAAELTAQARQAAEAQAHLGETREENELLLLQLHQVQEELEQYFLKFKATQQQLTEADARWQRMLQANPDYLDYATLDTRLDTDSPHHETRWSLQGVSTGGRSWPELTFATVVESGILGLRIPRDSGQLQRWPAQAEGDHTVLIPIGTRRTIQQRLQTLLDLSTTDWAFYQTLLDMVGQLLDKNLTTLPEAECELLNNALAKTRQIISKFPANLRYDTVSLKREQVNPDYEHLWLNIERLGFDGQVMPEFQFRVSCANVRPTLFGHYPKLEFPEQVSEQAFEGWFVEAYDDFGAKLELRFAMPESLDINVWDRLTERDHRFISALIKALPGLFATLQGTGRTLRRAWDDWLKMAGDMQRILTVRTAPPALPPTLEAAPAAQQVEVAAPILVPPATNPVPVPAPIAQPTPVSAAQLIKGLGAATPVAVPAMPARAQHKRKITPTSRKRNAK